jgi:hypothetical protein
MVTAMRFRPDEVLILYPPVRVEYERSSHYGADFCRIMFPCSESQIARLVERGKARGGGQM